MTWGNIAMFVIGFALIWIAIKKEYELMLLLPIGFGVILTNFLIPPQLASMVSDLSDEAWH